MQNQRTSTSTGWFDNRYDEQMEVLRYFVNNRVPGLVYDRQLTPPGECNFPSNIDVNATATWEYVNESTLALLVDLTVNGTWVLKLRYDEPIDELHTDDWASNLVNYCFRKLSMFALPPYSGVRWDRRFLAVLATNFIYAANQEALEAKVEMPESYSLRLNYRSKMQARQDFTISADFAKDIKTDKVEANIQFTSESEKLNSGIDPAVALILEWDDIYLRILDELIPISHPTDVIVEN